MICRENERSKIKEFVQEFTQNNKETGKRSLYISGNPGTGKSALLNEIIKKNKVCIVNLVNYVLRIQ